MYRLIIESSTAQASIALFDSEHLLVEENFPGGRGAASRFFSTLQILVKQVPTIDELVVGVGPGSYSGIRIGISAAIGLQLARGLVARGIHSAMGYTGADFQVVLDARGSFIYSAIRSDRLVSPPVHYSRTELEGKLDPELPLYSPDALPDLVPDRTFPTAGQIGKRLAEHTVSADLPLHPLYLKAPHITLPRNEPPSRS